MTAQDDDLQTYGPPAKFSEHKKGDVIRYRDVNTQEELEGVILAVQAAGTVIEGRDPFPLRYVVDRGDGSFPDIVYPSEVIQE